MEEVETIGDHIFLKNITYTQYKTICQCLLMNGNINVGRFLVLCYFTRLVIERKIIKYLGRLHYYLSLRYLPMFFGSYL